MNTTTLTCAETLRTILQQPPIIRSTVQPAPILRSTLAVGQGPAGAPGGRFDYIHTQLVPASVWIVTHGLGRYCQIVVIDSAQSVVIGDIIYMSENTVHIVFGAPFAGTAYCS